MFYFPLFILFLSWKNLLAYAPDHKISKLYNLLRHFSKTRLGFDRDIIV